MNAATTAFAGVASSSQARLCSCAHCQPTYYNVKSRYGGLGISEVKSIREMEAEHIKHKRMYADLAMQNDALRQIRLHQIQPGKLIQNGYIERFN
jgi:hypothetical protein